MKKRLSGYYRGPTLDGQPSNDPETILTRTGRLLLDMKESRYSYMLDNIRKRIEDEASYFDLKLTKVEDSSTVPIAHFADNMDIKKAFACPAKLEDAFNVRGKLLIDEYDNDKFCIFTIDLNGSTLKQIIQEYILKNIYLPKFGKIYFILFKIRNKDLKFKGPDQVNAFKNRLNDLALSCTLGDLVYDNSKNKHRLIIQEGWAGWLIQSGQIPPAELKLPDPDEKAKLEDQLKKSLVLHEEKEKMLEAQANIDGEEVDPMEEVLKDLDEQGKKVVTALMKVFKPQNMEILEKPEEEDDEKKVREELIKNMSKKGEAGPRDKEEQRVLRRSGYFMQVEPTAVLSPSKGQTVYHTYMCPEFERFESVTEKSKAHKDLNRMNPDGASFDGQLKKMLDSQKKMHNTYLGEPSGSSTPKRDQEEVARGIMDLTETLWRKVKSGKAERDDFGDYLENVSEELEELQRSGNGKASVRSSVTSEDVNYSGYTTPEQERGPSPLSQLSSLPRCEGCGGPRGICHCRSEMRQRRLERSIDAKKKLQFVDTSPVVRVPKESASESFEEKVASERNKLVGLVQTTLARMEKLPRDNPSSPKNKFDEEEMRKFREANPGSGVDRMCEEMDNKARQKVGLSPKPTTRIFSRFEFENLIEEKKDFLTSRNIELEPDDYCKLATKSGFMAMEMIEEKRELVTDIDVAEKATLEELVAKLIAEFDSSVVCKVCKEKHEDKKTTNK